VSKWIGVIVLAAVIVVMTLGCAQQPSATAGRGDKTDTVTPAWVTVKAGIITAGSRR